VEFVLLQQRIIILVLVYSFTFILLGGGITSFLNVVENKMKVERVKKITNGKSNIREILKLINL
jgi:hypothetical protein